MRFGKGPVFELPASMLRKIYLIRGEKVMLDRDLADLYQVETRVLNQAVRRNLDRFPADFMFVLTRDEIRRISQIVISLKYSNNVLAFTEKGVAMLSSVLNSKNAIRVNIEIIRTFALLREFILSHKDLQRKIEQMQMHYDKQFKNVFDALKALEAPIVPQKKRQIGFHTEI